MEVVPSFTILMVAFFSVKFDQTPIISLSLVLLLNDSHVIDCTHTGLLLILSKYENISICDTHLAIIRAPSSMRTMLMSFLTFVKMHLVFANSLTERMGDTFEETIIDDLSEFTSFSS